MTRKKFRLDRRNGKLMGVCSGVAEYTGIDATIVRVAVVLATLLGAFPWTLVAYAIAVWLGRDKGQESVGERRASTASLRADTTDRDRRLAEVDSFVASPNSRLSNEIEQLR